MSVPVKLAVGLMTAPMAWALSTTLGPLLPHVDCRHDVSFLLISVSGAFALALCGIIASARMHTALGREIRFVKKASGGVAMLCLFAMLLQGMAAVLVGPCMQ